MAQLRVERLYQALSADEKFRLREQIKRTGRAELDSLCSCLDELLVSGEILENSKEKVFKSVFKKKYEDSLDYLFRNECRLLTNEIYDLLTIERFARDYRRGMLNAEVVLLRELYSRKLWLEFESKAESIAEQAKEQNDFSTLFEVLDRRVDAASVSGAITPQLMDFTEGIIKNALGAVDRFNQYAQWKLLARLRALEHTRKRSRIQFEPFDEKSLPLPTEDNALAQHYFNLSYALSSPADESIEYSIKALERINFLPDNTEELRKARVIATGTHGTLLALGQRYLESTEVLEEALRLADGYSIVAETGIAYNLISMLIQLQDYQKTLVYLEKFRERLMADVRLKFRFECLNCFTYIFLGNVDQAAKAIPTDITKRAESEYHFFLHVVSIVAFLQGDIETALRETMNLIKRFDRGKDTINVSFERHVAVAFRSFYQMSLEESKSKKLRFRRSITDALEELFGEAPHYRDYLPVLWLTRRLN